MSAAERGIRLSIPRGWRRLGLAVPRRHQSRWLEGLASLYRRQLLPLPAFARRWAAAHGATFGSLVMGDPCVVWDEDVASWRMFLFCLPPGHAQAVCLDGDLTRWRVEGPLRLANPEALPGGEAYKPFVVMDPHRPNRAARIDGRLCLLLVTNARARYVQRAWSERLVGPWRIEDAPLIRTGSLDEFDAKHVDAVSGYYFAERREFLYFYMGHPARPQPRTRSPYGSAQGAAVQRVGEPSPRKLGPILSPCESAGHWAAGWVGGLQLLPGREHRWIAVVNASPTPPDPTDTRLAREEPPPSLGGFAGCDEAWPVTGWRWEDAPIEWIDDLPADARQNGEGVNFWRHHIVALPAGRLALLYNSGAYFAEQIYAKLADAAWE